MQTSEIRLKGQSSKKQNSISTSLRFDRLIYCGRRNVSTTKLNSSKCQSVFEVEFNEHGHGIYSQSVYKGILFLLHK